MFDPTLLVVSLMLAAQPQTDAAPASPEPPSPRNEDMADDKGKGEDRLICRRTATVGSKFTKRMCATKAQWDELARTGSATARDMQRRGRGFEPGN